MQPELSAIQDLAGSADSKVVLLVIDGVGGLPMEPGGKTELEAANTPNLDKLAAQSICGLQVPVGPGITPGSGPGHLGLFGYDPLQYKVGRGVLSALGVDFDLGPQDVAARGNFCTLDANGLVTDRRAGRISTEKNEELCQLLQQIELPGVETFVQTVKEHRMLLVLRGEGLSGGVDDTDPQATGKAPLEPVATENSPEAQRTTSLVKQFTEQAREILADHSPANMLLLRGFAKFPDWPQFPDVFGVKAAAIAAYPMYRGVAKLVGMNALKTKDTPAAEFQTVADNWNDYDFFYVHIKRTDSRGEDGDFDAKVAVIEEVDQSLPHLLDLGPDVVVVTGDHSTPAKMKVHSWHPVPALIYSDLCRPDLVTEFGERPCLGGGLGPRLPAISLMPLAFAHAGRLEKFGA